MEVLRAWNPFSYWTFLIPVYIVHKDTKGLWLVAGYEWM